MESAKHEINTESLMELVGKPVVESLAVLSGAIPVGEAEKAARVLADVFGDRGSFSKLLGEDSAERREKEKKLLTGFQNNLNLLIEKTWVEKTDEELKEQVLYRLKLFCARLSEYRYADSYNDFMEIIHDTVYLMFGKQAEKDDFPEYALRIDPDFGVFWQYVKTLAGKDHSLKEKKACETCRIMLLLGMVFLANY
jgi:hypothetical protein